MNEHYSIAILLILEYSRFWRCCSSTTSIHTRSRPIAIRLGGVSPDDETSPDSLPATGLSILEASDLKSRCILPHHKSLQFEVGQNRAKRRRNSCIGNCPSQYLLPSICAPTKLLLLTEKWLYHPSQRYANPVYIPRLAPPPYTRLNHSRRWAL